MIVKAITIIMAMTILSNNKRNDNDDNVSNENANINDSNINDRNNNNNNKDKFDYNCNNLNNYNIRIIIMTPNLRTSIAKRFNRKKSIQTKHTHTQKGKNANAQKISPTLYFVNFPSARSSQRAGRPGPSGSRRTSSLSFRRVSEMAEAKSMIIYGIHRWPSRANKSVFASNHIPLIYVMVLKATLVFLQY